MKSLMYQCARAVAFYSVSLALLPYAYGQADSPCRVKITQPEPGSRAGATTNVRGEATLPSGAFLWVFAHREGLAVWWPQGGGAARVRDGKWVVLATLGGPQDRGASFEVLAGVVDRETSAKLDAWQDKGDKTDSYQGIRLPTFLEECGRPPEIVVAKVD